MNIDLITIKKARRAQAIAYRNGQVRQPEISTQDAELKKAFEEVQKENGKKRRVVAF
ncbi:hypothetical protein [[Curtobacterium] plantarum]|uniref:hypothetical protein n=1 Tax=[Curtobacterium] plantarum TaxID=221276 RepID=UPI001313E7E1|nr:hypothetical protein [[Curtobacterium] plantarum]